MPSNPLQIFKGPARAPIEDKLLRDLGLTLIWSVVAIVAAVVSVGFAAASETLTQGIQFIGISGLTAIAATSLGGVAGFIFGIPRTLAEGGATSSGPGAPGAAGPGATLGSNTNLEQISDWLTKIVVGATLVQVEKLPAGLGAISQAITTAFGDSRLGTACSILVVVFVPLGFLAMYLQTRTFLSIMFARTQTLMNDGNLLKAGDDQALAAAAGAAAVKGAASTASPETVEIAHRTLEATSTPSTPEALKQRGLAHAVLGQWSAAGDELRGAASQLNDPKMRDLAALALARARRPSEARALLPTVAPEDAQTIDRQEAKALLNKMFVALYEPEPEGYRAALQIADRLKDAPAVTSDRDLEARLHLYRAAALGQKARHSKAKPTTASFKALSDEAFAEATRTVELDPGYKVTIRNMLTGRGGDDDLVVFADEERFKALVG